VDGFDQDEAADECEVLAAERDTFEALDLAHHLLDSRPRFVGAKNFGLSMVFER
jgi:hypothetical protein